MGFASTRLRGLKSGSVNLVWLQVRRKTRKIVKIRSLSLKLKCGSCGCCPCPLWNRWSSSTHGMSGSLCFFSSYNFCLRPPGVTCSCTGWSKSSRWLSGYTSAEEQSLHNLIMRCCYLFSSSIINVTFVDWNEAQQQKSSSCVEMQAHQITSCFWWDFQFDGTKIFLGVMRSEMSRLPGDIRPRLGKFEGIPIVHCVSLCNK